MTCSGLWHLPMMQGKQEFFKCNGVTVKVDMRRDRRMTWIKEFLVSIMDQQQQQSLLWHHSTFMIYCMFIEIAWHSPPESALLKMWLFSQGEYLWDSVTNTSLSTTSRLCLPLSSFLTKTATQQKLNLNLSRHGIPVWNDELATSAPFQLQGV